MFFTENSRSHVETGQVNEKRREEEAHVGPEGVIDNPPGEGEDSLLQTLTEILAILDQGPVIQSQVSIQVT